MDGRVHFRRRNLASPLLGSRAMSLGKVTFSLDWWGGSELGRGVSGRGVGCVVSDASWMGLK